MRATGNASEWFRTTAPDDPAFVAHELRRARSSDDLRGALETLRDVAARFPDSDYAQAALDVALIRGTRHAERAEAFRERAERAEGETQARLAWRAAQLSSADADGADHAQALYSLAIEASTTSKAAIVREALGAAMRAKRPDAVLARCDELMQSDIEPDERATLAYFKYDFTRHALHAEQDAEQLLARRPGRLQQSRLGSSACTRAGGLERRRGFACPSSRGDAQRSRLGIVASDTCALRDRLTRETGTGTRPSASFGQRWPSLPNDGYVVSLLDAVLREGGRPDDVVALARERSKADSRTALGELSLLLAGATAERTGNLTAARHAYEQALADAPGSTSAALALLDIARRQSDASATRRAYAALSDGGLGGGVPELFALLRGDSLGPDDDIGACRAYERALEHPSTATAAAIAILSLPVNVSNADQRAAAEELLADAGATTIADTDGFAAGYGALRASLGEEGSSAGDAWLQLSAAAPTEGLRAAALLQGLRASGIARGIEAADELFMLAQEAEALSGLHPDAAVAIDEALAPSDDAALRVHALEQKRQHSEAVGRGALDAAHCRALVEADRGAEAVALLSNAIDERPDDLALWETLRSAARQAGEWPMVAQACERLAPFVEDSLRGDLLEEAGVVRMDCLQQYQQAEDLFRRALEEDPTRDLAFRRLRDLFVAHEDAEALEVLVAERLALGGPKDRPALLYERARLLRGFSDRPGALEVLDELFTTDPDHAGALALAAEVHVSLERWAEAVDCLQRLSKANIPGRAAARGAPRSGGFPRNAAWRQSRGPRGAAGRRIARARRRGNLDADRRPRNRARAPRSGNRCLQTRPRSGAGQRDGNLGPGRARRRHGGRLRRRKLRSRHLVTDRGRRARPVASRSLAKCCRMARPRCTRGRGPRRPARVRARRADQTTSAQTLARSPLPALWDPKADPVLQELVLRAGPALGSDRLHAKRADPNDPIVTELERLSQRFGARTGSIEVSDEATTLVARTGRDGEIRWVVPRRARGGLDATGRFNAGRLAWAAPHGGAQLLDGSPERAAGILLAVLRVSRCEVEAGDPPLPATDVKLRRAVRKAVHQAVRGTKLHSSSLLAYARSLQRSADRAGLLACGEIGAGLAVLLNQELHPEALRMSSRGLDLLRFWLDADSPLWGSHG